MAKLILVRHGQSTGNAERVYATNPHALALTELGEQQACEAGRKIGKLFRPELVVASSYLRAEWTGRLIAEVLGLPLMIEQNLHERDAGLFMGKAYDSIASADGYDPKQPWLWRPPKGESLEDVKDRAAPVIDRLAAAHRDRDVVVVSHGGVMYALWAHFTGGWEGAQIPQNCGIVEVEHDGLRYGSPVVIGDQTGDTSTGG